MNEFFFKQEVGHSLNASRFCLAAVCFGSGIFGMMSNGGVL